MRGKNAIVFNANDPQLPQAHLFIESLRDPLRGNYDGDIWIVSTGLSSKAKSYAEIMKINYIEDCMDFLWDWPYWQIAAEYTIFDNMRQLQKGEILLQKEEILLLQERLLLNRKEVLKESFYQYRNKRLSKLLFIKFLELYENKYEKVLLCDSDILAQKPVKEVFDQVVDDRLYYWRQENQMLPGRPLWKKNLYFKKLIKDKNKNIDFGKHEINIGFLGGKPHSTKKIWSMQKRIMLSKKYAKLIPYGWHEQDYFRLLRSLQPKSFALFSEGTVIHTCDDGKMMIKEAKPLEFRFVLSNAKPAMVHFAGGTWAFYESIKRSYSFSSEEFLSYYL